MGIIRLNKQLNLHQLYKRQTLLIQSNRQQRLALTRDTTKSLRTAIGNQKHYVITCASWMHQSGSRLRGLSVNS